MFLCQPDEHSIPCDISRESRKWKIVREGVTQKGENSTIYVVEDDQTDIQYIAKMIRYSKRHRLTRSEKTQRIEQEICLQHLCAQNRLAPRIHNYFFCRSVSDDVNAVIIMDYLHGPTLGQYLEQRRQQVKDYPTYHRFLAEVLDVYSQVFLRVYEMVCDIRVFNPDLHEDNVILSDRNGGIQFIDFGSAWKLDKTEEASQRFHESLQNICLGYVRLYQAYRQSPDRLDTKTNQVLRTDPVHLTEFDLIKYTMIAINWFIERVIPIPDFNYVTLAHRCLNLVKQIMTRDIQKIKI